MPATAFDVLAEPARRELLDLLIDGPRPVGELVAKSGLSQPNTSRHLRILREAQLVRVSVDGQRRLYQLDAEGLLEIERWLAPYMRLWANSLDALQTHLDDTEQR
jgi:DNA-binding transcriptional ArsR family regulator